MTKDEVKKLRMDSPESLQFLNNATKFYNLMMMYRCAIREIQTKLEVLDDEFSAENNRNPISFIKTRIKKPNSIYDKLQKMGYEFTTENIQTYLNDVAGVRIVCAFIDDNRLDEQIRQAVLSLETKWTEKEIGFQVELEEVKYTANEGLFMHIWINLLDNAIKFSPSKGTITMFLKQEQDSVKFILEDEGPGIEDDVKSRIFDKFYQVDGSHKAEGNGLGLALVKRIVDSAGGTIKAENREYGGCRFVIELPKQKDEII